MLRHPAGHASLPSDWQLTENYREIRRYTTCALPRYLFNFWKLNSKLIFIPPLSLQYERLLLMESPIARGTWVLPLHIEHEFFPHWLIIPLLWAALRRIKPSAGMNFAQYCLLFRTGSSTARNQSWPTAELKEATKSTSRSTRELLVSCNTLSDTLSDTLDTGSNVALNPAATKTEFRNLRHPAKE